MLFYNDFHALLKKYLNSCHLNCELLKSMIHITTLTSSTFIRMIRLVKIAKKKVITLLKRFLFKKKFINKKLKKNIKNDVPGLLTD